MNPHKKPINRAEWLEKYRQQAWEGDLSAYDEFSQEAIEGMQYQPATETAEKTMQRLENKLSITTNQQNTKVRTLRRVMSIAAGFLILVLGVYFLYLQPPSDAQLFSQHFEYLPIALAGADREANRGDTANASLQSVALEAYNHHDYQKAEGLFRAYLAEHPSDREMQFYYGIILLGKGETDGAVPLLRQMRVEPVRTSYYRPASWYLSLAYLRQDKEQLMLPLLEELAGSNAKDKYGIKARALLKSL